MTFKPARLIPLAVFAGLLAGPAASLQAAPASPESTIRTGAWEYKTKALGFTVDSEIRCVTPKDVGKFFDGPCNRHHTCTYPVREVADGKAKFDGYWENNKGQRAIIHATGAYTPTTFNLSVHGTGTNGMTLPNPKLAARWISDTCPSGAKRP